MTETYHVVVTRCEDGIMYLEPGRRTWSPARHDAERFVTFDKAQVAAWAMDAAPEERREWRGVAYVATIEAPLNRRDQWCPSCGCRASVWKYTGYHHVTGVEQNHHQCLNCGHWHTIDVQEKDHG